MEYGKIAKNVVGCTWKYKVKFNPDGFVNKPESRLVAQGFTQKERVNYHDSFSIMAKWQTIGILIYMVTMNQWSLRQIDISQCP